MRLIELNEGDRISIEVIFSGKNYEFSTNVSGKMNDFILSDVVTSDEKVVGFTGDDIMLNLIYYREEKTPIVWTGIGCTLVEYKGKMQYRIKASGEGFEKNRRQAFRLFVGNDAVVQIGLNRKSSDATLKDISETGFAFITEDNVEDAENMAVRAVFSDTSHSISLIGRIVRKVELEDKRVLYGCQLTSHNQILSRYINEKQRQRLAAGRSLSNGTKKIVPEQEKDTANTRATAGKKKDDEHLKYNKRHMPLSKPTIGTIEKDERRKIFDDDHHGKKV